MTTIWTITQYDEDLDEPMIPWTEAFWNYDRAHLAVCDEIRMLAAETAEDDESILETFNTIPRRPDLIEVTDGDSLTFTIIRVQVR